MPGGKGGWWEGSLQDPVVILMKKKKHIDFVPKCLLQKLKTHNVSLNRNQSEPIFICDFVFCRSEGGLDSLFFGCSSSTKPCYYSAFT